MSTTTVHDIQWQYDPETDVLVIEKGVPQPSRAVEVDGVEGMHIRYSFSSGEVTGVVILYYSCQDRNHLVANMPFPFDFSDVGNSKSQ